MEIRIGLPQTAALAGILLLSHGALRLHFLTNLFKNTSEQHTSPTSEAAPQQPLGEGQTAIRDQRPVTLIPPQNRGRQPHRPVRGNKPR